MAAPFVKHKLFDFAKKQSSLSYDVVESLLPGYISGIGGEYSFLCSAILFVHPVSPRTGGHHFLQKTPDCHVASSFGEFFLRIVCEFLHP